MLTERQAWLKIARACDRAGIDGRLRIGRDSWPGLCSALCAMLGRGFIDHATYLAMNIKIDEHAPAHGRFDYAWPQSKAGAKSRAAFCRKMAALCKPAKKRIKAKA